MLKKVFLYLATFLALNLFTVQALSATTDLSTEEFAKKIEESKGKADVVLLDVRTPQEFGEGHLEKAIMLDFRAPDFAAKLDKLDKAKTYLVYCRSGNRSGQTIELMKKSGFSRIFNMVGGLNRWREEKRPVSVTK